MFLRNIFKFQLTQSVGMKPLECEYLVGLTYLTHSKAQVFHVKSDEQFDTG